jgi:hypothetical protein
MEWLWCLALSAFLFGTYRALAFTSDWIAQWITQPKFLIRMIEQDPNYFMEMPLQGNWLLPLTMLLFSIVNVLGQELWFRGLILPRQELVFVEKTWLVHGILWFFFYLFMPWHALQILPGCLALPYVVQRLQNTSVGILSHFAVSLPGWIQLIARI